MKNSLRFAVIAVGLFTATSSFADGWRHPAHDVGRGGRGNHHGGSRYEPRWGHGGREGRLVVNLPGVRLHVPAPPLPVLPRVSVTVPHRQQGHYESRSVQTWVDGRWVQVNSCTGEGWYQTCALRNEWVGGHYEWVQQQVWVPGC